MTHAHRFKVDKLIRDKLPEIMRESGIECFERAMEKEEYIQRLKDKLLEEAQEVRSTHPKEIREELADLLEVVMALARIHNIEFEEVAQTADQKRSEKGSFEKRVYSPFVEMDAGHPALGYYRARPDQYPEIK